MVWSVITDFGDSAAMLPAAAVLLAWLAADGRTRAAVLWGGLFAAQAALVAATKIAFRGWGIGIEALDFTGLSGHAALACSVVPIGLYLATRRAGPAIRLGAAAAGLAFGLLIGLSRIALWQHSWSEVAGGCLLGGLTAVVFIALSGRGAGSARLPAPMMAAVLAVFVLLMHGTRAPSEQLITRIALHLSGRTYPYVRDPWRDLGHRRWLGNEWDASAAPSVAFPRAPVQG